MMKRLSVSVLAIALVAGSGAASAQSYRDQGAYPAYAQTYLQPRPDRYGRSDNAHYDYARVLRVDPVLDGYRRTGYDDRRCRQRQTYANVGNGYYDRGRGYYGDRYRDDYYRRDARRDRGYGNDNGRAIASVIGGVLGAVVGSQVGGGSARYATSAIGTMVGSIAGREIYESSQRDEYRRGVVTVCDPVRRTGQRSRPFAAGGVTAYDVTYEYAGRTYTTRTNYHPGDRIRVRVEVRPQ